MINDPSEPRFMQDPSGRIENCLETLRRIKTDFPGGVDHTDDYLFIYGSWLAVIVKAEQQLIPQLEANATQGIPAADTALRFAKQHWALRAALMQVQVLTQTSRMLFVMYLVAGDVTEAQGLIGEIQRATGNILEATRKSPLPNTPEGDWVGVAKRISDLGDLIGKYLEGYNVAQRTSEFLLEKCREHENYDGFSHVFSVFQKTAVTTDAVFKELSKGICMVELLVDELRRPLADIADSGFNPALLERASLAIAPVESLVSATDSLTGWASFLAERLATNVVKNCDELVQALQGLA